MKFTARIALGILTALALVLAACSGGGGGAKGKGVFAVSDDAANMGAVTSVKVTVDAVRIHGQGEAWTTVSSNAQTFDLLELKAKGAAKLLAQADLDAGSYDQMELSISKVVVVDSKGEHEAKLPSNKLQLKGDLDVRANTTATANFDFIADQSLHVAGDGRYILAPVIQLETKSNATADIQSNNEVRIIGGTTTTNVLLGTDIRGNVGVGLKISPSAVLSIDASGRILQTRGEVIIGGVVKAVDSANGTVTVSTKGGADLVLKLAGGTTVQPGSEVVATYDAETKAATRVTAQVQAQVSVQGSSSSQTSAQTKATVAGTIKAVDVVAGTITVAAKGGGDLVVKVTSDTKIAVEGAASTLATLATKVGSQVTAEYNAQTNAATSLNAQAQASAVASASGTLKSVDVLLNKVTISTAGGVELALNLTAQSKIMVGGSASTTAALATMVGKATTVEYNAETKAVVSLNVQN